MNKLDELIHNIEMSNATGKWGTNAETINPLLVELGGKPICINDSLPGAGDGSMLSEIRSYMTLLVVRNTLNKPNV